jgi:hypothetical protein
MLAKMVDPMQAKLMYYAVYRFGPRWVVDKNFTCPPMCVVRCALSPGGSPPALTKVNVTPTCDDDKEFREATSEIEKGNLSLAKIRKSADESFYKQDQVFTVKGKVNARGQELSINQRARLREVPGLEGSLAYLLKAQSSNAAGR